MEDSAPTLGEVSPTMDAAAPPSGRKLARFKLRDVLIGGAIVIVFRVGAVFASRLQGQVPAWLLLLLALVLPQMLLFAWPALLLWWRGEVLPGPPARGEKLLIDVILGFLTAGSLYFCLVALGLLLRWLWPEVTVTTQQTTSGFLNGPWYQLLLILFFAAVVAPICEEFFFRGFLYNALRQRIPVVWAILLQAVFFGAVHTFGVLHSVLVTGVAIVLALAYQWRQTLVTPMVAHCLFNTVQILILVLTKVLLASAPFLGIAAISHDEGIEVVQVVENSPAEKAGIATGDVITQFNGRPVRTFLDLQVQLMQRKPGDEVKIELLRDGSTKTVTAVLARRPDNTAPGQEDEKP